MTPHRRCITANPVADHTKHLRIDDRFRQVPPYTLCRPNFCGVRSDIDCGWRLAIGGRFLKTLEEHFRRHTRAPYSDPLYFSAKVSSVIKVITPTPDNRFRWNVE